MIDSLKTVNKHKQKIQVLKDSIKTFETQKNDEQHIKTVGDSLNQNLKGIIAELRNGNKHEKIFNLISYDTAFATIITISIFVLGVLVDRGIEFFEKKEERKKLRKLYRQIVNEFSEKLLPIINKYYQDVYQTNNVDTGMEMAAKIPTNDLERLDRIDFYKLFQAFSNKKSLSIVVTQLDFILGTINAMDNYHNQLYSENQNRRTIYYDLTNKYLDLLAGYVDYENKTNPQRANDSSYILVNKSLFHFHTNIAGTRGLRRFYREILRPIQLELVESRKYETHELGIEIIKLGKDLTYKFNELKRQTIEMRIQYRNIYRQMNEATIRLNAEKINLRM
ncbi:MAG: hypothetical protein QM734_07035 [Cyclobacteriaceae bacterium]